MTWLSCLFARQLRALCFRSRPESKRNVPLYLAWFRSFVPRRPARRDRARRRLLLESLEGRITPATITVLTNGDATGALTQVSSGVYTAPTLRAAIDAANDQVDYPGPNTIDFAAGVDGQTIKAVANDTTHPFAFGPTAFAITSNITITGDVSQPVVTISGNNNHRIFVSVR
jgi:hypothetical protein